MGIVSNWMESRNTHYKDAPRQQVPIDILNSTKDTDKFCKWMVLFVAGDRCEDGNKYPPKAIYLLLASTVMNFTMKDCQVYIIQK